MRSDVEVMLTAIHAAGDDPEAVGEALDHLDGMLADLDPREARVLYEAVRTAEKHVRAERDRISTELGGAGHRGRAMRGFGRAIRTTTFLRGQRVDRDV